MNENIDLTKILKNCPKGTKFYSSTYGDVCFECIKDSVYPIQISHSSLGIRNLSEKGRMFIGMGECCIFPSKDQRDWSKFSAPWYKEKKFDPKILKPFDKVLVREDNFINWNCDLFSHINNNDSYKYKTISNSCKQCIPYNDDTKHLIGTKEEAPEYYRYWED